MKMKFYRCKHCGQIIAKVKDTNVPVICCGEPMAEIIPGTSDGAKEKHVPVLERNGNKITIKVGSVAHPMEEAHYIEWIAIQTNNGNQRKSLKPGDKPEATFYVDNNDVIEAVYAYCNLHSLFKGE